MDIPTHVSNQYDDFQTLLESVQKERKYLNYGFRTARRQSYEDKQRNLCIAVFDAADLSARHTVVDVGFGSGEQDFLLAEHYPYKKLIGYNIAGSQVEYANARAAEMGLKRKMEFRTGPAEDMSRLRPKSVDRVLAVECAFYFDRPRFYAEAARVLKPGGRLILADICFSDRLAWAARRNPALRRVGWKSSNRTDWERFFKTVRLQSIRRETLPGAQQTVFIILGLLLRNYSSVHRTAWGTALKMAISSQIVAAGLLSGGIRYDLIVLER